MSTYTPLPTSEPSSSRHGHKANDSISYISPDHAPLLGSSAPLPPRQDILDQDEDDFEDDTHLTGLPTGTFFGSTVNLANTILGTGMLAMPSAIASIGLIPGIFMIIYSGLASALGLYFLSLCAARTSKRSASFFTISKYTYPTAAIYFDLAIAIKCFGVSISYLIIIGDLMPEIIWRVLETADEHPLLLDRRFWISIFMLIIAPMAFFRRLDSLKYTSVVALFAVVYLVSIVLWYYIIPTATRPGPGEIEWATFSPKFFKALPIFVFGFTCHQNIFSVYNELYDNSQPSINSVITTSITAAAGVYETIGVLGYLSYGKKVRPNIILEYPDSVFVTIGRFALVLLNLFSYALQAHPARASLDKVLTWRTPASTGLKTPPQPSAVKYISMTTGLLVFSYLIAITVSQLDLVLAFVGSTGSTIISFILPGIFYVKLTETEGWHSRRILAAALAGYGFTVMTICLSYNIFNLSDVGGHLWKGLN